MIHTLHTSNSQLYRLRTIDSNENPIRNELERRKQEIEREKDELKQFYSEAFDCSTHSVNHDPNFLQLLDDVVVSTVPSNPIMYGLYRIAHNIVRNCTMYIYRVVKEISHLLDP